jgi:hypothetical protein
MWKSHRKKFKKLKVTWLFRAISFSISLVTKIIVTKFLFVRWVVTYVKINFWKLLSKIRFGGNSH